MTVGRPELLGGAVPRTAAQHAELGRGRTARVFSRTLLVVGFTVPVVTPLPDVAVHLEKAPAVGLLLSQMPRFALRICLEPGVSLQLGLVVTETVLPDAAGATGIFPFRLSGKPVAIGVEVALPGIQVVTGGQPFPLRTLVTETDSIGPLCPLDGVTLAFVLRGIDAHDLLIEFLRHRILVEVKRVDRNGVRSFVRRPGAVAHLESAGRDQDHGVGGPVEPGPSGVGAGAAGYAANDGHQRPGHISRHMRFPLPFR